MFLEEMNAMTYTWNFLQQPVHPGQGKNASFWSLLAALDQGWLVEEPVLLAKADHPTTPTYLFNLRDAKTRETCRIIVPATPEIDSLIRSNNYQVAESDHPCC